MRKPCVSFEEFDAACRAAGAEATKFTDIHWRIVGHRGNEKLLVDFWPTGKPGPKYLVVGRERRAIAGDHETAIAAATGKAANPSTGVADELGLLRNVARLAIGYLQFDGKLLDQMCAEQAHACVDLLAALRAAGYRMSAA